MNFVFGIGGFAKDVDWLIDEIFRSKNNDYRPDYFVVENSSPYLGQYFNDKLIISEEQFLKQQTKTCSCFIAVGNPAIRLKIVSKIKQAPFKIAFPNLIHPDVTFDRRSDRFSFGEGNIVCSKSTLSTGGQIGSFVHINADCTVGHEAIIGNFCTLSPGAHVSGNVMLEDGVFIGAGAVILERLSISSRAVVGAGAVVVKNIVDDGTYVGVPANLIKS